MAYIDHNTLTSDPTSALPWPDAATPLITDAGLETWAIFHRGLDLPAFAAYPLVATEHGRALLLEYFGQFLRIARAVDAGVLLEAPTWRANPDWASSLGHDLEELGRHIDDSVELLRELRQRWDSARPFLISGTVGPRGDGYEIGTTMSVAEARDYHSWQIGRLSRCGADLATALTIGYVDEAVGIATAARDHGMPVVISFTLETDGRLPSGATLAQAITATDAATEGYPQHYMINCAHPSHFDRVLDGYSTWVRRIGGLRANASSLSHAELDEMVELDEGDPHDLADRYARLRSVLPALQVVGGCCGTDERHVGAIATAMFGRARG